MHTYSPTPHALYTLDMEKRWKAAQAAMLPKVSSLRKSGCRVSFYRESMIVTLPVEIGSGVFVIDCTRPTEGRALGGTLVPSVKAAAGVAYGRRFRVNLDWRRANA